MNQSKKSRVKTEQLNVFDVPKEHTVKLVNLRMVCEDTGQYCDSVSQPEDVIKIAKPLFEGAWREIVAVICVDVKNKPTAISVVNIGGVAQSLVSPANVWKLALTTNAQGIILLHNHPAGSLEPSRADRDLTEKIKEGGKLLEIELIDHIIIAGPDCSRFYSFRSNCLL